MRIRVDRTWDGQPLRSDECVEIELARTGDALLLRVDAPWHGDPLPPGEPGRPTERLWDYEVVELFLLEPPDHYLEIELGPHGHYNVLELKGVRRFARTGLTIDFEVWHEPVDTRWRGQARVPIALLPAATRTGTTRANAYAIHGVGAERRHLAWQPVPGDAPDFHRLAAFAPIDLDALPQAPEGR